MSIGKRFYELRQALDLNQTDFGRPILVSQTTVGQMENETRVPTERTIVLTIDKWHCSESWLRTGEGPMFNDDTDEIDSVARQLNLSKTQTRLLRLIHGMTVEQQILVQQLAHQLAGDEPPESDYDRTARIARAALEEHDQQQAEIPQDKRA